MRNVNLLTVITLIILVSCEKQRPTLPPSPMPVTVKKILLKDITIPNLPSPYYQFEYGADSAVVKASFASGLNSYDVVYNGNRIVEMRSNNIVNHDTLRYDYDNTGKVATIKFISGSTGVIFRHAFFTYTGQQLQKIEWDHKDANTGFVVDRSLSFVYLSDGNIKEIREHRPAMSGQPEADYTTQFEQYDDKVNIDDFSLLHDSFHDHLFLVKGLKLQKNNPRKEIRTGNGVNYTANYTYTYNSDGAPLTKLGDVLFTQGPEAGQRFQTRSDYNYY
jgi:hypothetical protein